MPGWGEGDSALPRPAWRLPAHVHIGHWASRWGVSWALIGCRAKRLFPRCEWRDGVGALTKVLPIAGQHEARLQGGARGCGQQHPAGRPGHDVSACHRMDAIQGQLARVPQVLSPLAVLAGEQGWLFRRNPRGRCCLSLFLGLHRPLRGSLPGCRAPLAAARWGLAALSSQPPGLPWVSALSRLCVQMCCLGSGVWGDGQGAPLLRQLSPAQS